GGADDDLAALLLLHLGNHGEAGVIHAPLVDGSGLLQDLLLGHVGVAVEGAAGVGSQDVDAAELVDGLLDDGFHLSLVGDVHGLIEAGHAALSGDVVDDLLGLDGVQVGDDDLGAFLGIQLGSGFTHTGTAAGNNCNLVFQHVDHNKYT